MTSVQIYVYDLSQGLAKALSSQLLGQHLDGIWHTGIVVYGKEHFFGSGGIEWCSPGDTVLGNPLQVVDLGFTEVPEDLFYSYLADLRQNAFRPETYHLFDHNCNTFSDEVAFFLTNKRVPSNITDLPRSIATTPIGQMVRSFVDKMAAPGLNTTHFEVPETPDHSRTTAKSSKSPSPRSKSKSPSPKRPISASPEPSSFGEPFLIEEEASADQCSGFDSNSNATSSQRGLYEFATSTEEPKWGLGPKHFSLIGKDLRKATDEEQLTVLSLFRVSLYRSTDVAIGLLRDRNRSLISLLEDGEESSSEFSIKLLQVACNFVGKLGLANEPLSESFRPLLVQLAVKGLDEGHEKLLPATQLAFNLTAVQAVQDDAILCLGSILIHVLCCADASSPSPAYVYAVKALLNLCRLNDDIRQLAVVQGLDTSALAGEDGERLQAILHGNL